MRSHERHDVPAGLHEIIIGKMLEIGYAVSPVECFYPKHENDVFMIHPFCYCEKEDCPWCEDDAPNFLYKPTGFKVWWYKHIGRGMEMEGTYPLDMVVLCIQSLNV